MWPCEDESSSCMTEVIRGRVLMCMTIGLYVHRSFHRGGWSDGHITLTVRPPSCVVWRQAPVNLNRSPSGVRSTHCSVVKEPGSTAHSTRLSSMGPHSISPLRTSSNGRPRGRRKRKGTPLWELVQLIRFDAPNAWSGPAARRCMSVSKYPMGPSDTHMTLNVDRRFPRISCACQGARLCRRSGP
jgi:hypothetical protein